MKETIGSMRVYFFLVGGVTVLIGIASLTADSPNIGVLVGSLIAAAFGAAFFYAGSTLKTAITNAKTNPIRIIVYANMAVNVLIGLLVLAETQKKHIPAIRMVVAVAIGFYLLANLKRLVKENALSPVELVETAPPPLPEQQATIVSEDTANED